SARAIPATALLPLLSTSRPPLTPPPFPYPTLFRSAQLAQAFAGLEVPEPAHHVVGHGGEFGAVGGHRQLPQLPGVPRRHQTRLRSEEHTSELQSLTNLVCRLLLEQNKKSHPTHAHA